MGKRKHYVAVDPSRFDEPVRNFGTFTQDLEAMAEWLSSCGVREVAMESTGVYWIPVFEVLDRAGFQVHLVNPRATKQVSGRKSDVLDCQWIRQLMSYGLLRGAFRAPDALCPMRSYVRQRGQLTRDRSRAVQHMQKALGQMNVPLDNVLSDIMGKTGQLIMRAIVAGGRAGRGGAGEVPGRSLQGGRDHHRGQPAGATGAANTCSPCNRRWPATTCCKARSKRARRASTPNSTDRPRARRRTSRARRGVPARALCASGYTGCWGPT